MTHPTDDSLKPCPFCGAGTTEITPNGRMWTGMKYSEPSSVSVRHWCETVPGQPSRMLERVGRDEASAIAAWNGRALLAEQAQEPKAEDAELLDWLEEKHYALHPIKEAAGDDQYTLWWQVTDKRKSISGHPLGNIRAAIRAARAAERKA